MENIFLVSQLFSHFIVFEFENVAYGRGRTASDMKLILPQQKFNYFLG